MKKERDAEDELRFINQIQNLGFVLRADDIRDDDDFRRNGGDGARGKKRKIMGWSRSDFEIDMYHESNNGTGRRSLTVHTHPQLGINVSINSTPFNERYHFATQRPVTEEGALYHIRRYLETTVENLEYVPLVINPEDIPQGL